MTSPCPAAAASRDGWRSYRGTCGSRGRVRRADRRRQRHPVPAARRRCAKATSSWSAAGSIRAPGARHAGRERVFWDAAPVWREPEDGLLVLRERRRRSASSRRPAPASRRARSGPRCSSRPAGTYNRIEGCRSSSVRTFELRPTPGAPSLALDLRGHPAHGRRKARGLSSDFGYQVRAEYPHVALRGLAGECTASSRAIEDQPLSLSETGWAAFLLQRDYRDYFERRGGGGCALGAARPAAPIRAVGAPRRRERRSAPSIPGRCSATATTGAATR